MRRKEAAYDRQHGGNSRRLDRRRGELAVGGDGAGVGHARQTKVGSLRQHGGEHDMVVTGQQAAVQMGEGRTETGPAVHLGEQVGDAYGRDTP